MRWLKREQRILELEQQVREYAAKCEALAAELERRGLQLHLAKLGMEAAHYAAGGEIPDAEERRDG